ncbi:MAG: EI24 domain-containing protein [Pseudomonadota bacterium]|jgi:uncharacterized protein involved in cysteine biosynthesis|uniref:Membrane protein n=1 Tax=hydrothermal vent metagenome TaxID=652676 RepID=A0A170PP70_9ZZZZ
MRGYTGPMLRAFFLSVGQLGDPKIIRVFLKSLGLTLLLLALFGIAMWYGAQGLVARMGAGAEAGGWVGAATVLLWLAAAFFLFRAIAIAVVGIFADEVVAAVEEKHYPEALAEARDVPFGRSVRMGLGSAARLILINLAVSPLYLLLLITGVGTALLFFIVNGWLLGQDLGEMVAARHLPHKGMTSWRGSTSMQRFALGLAGTALFLVPILNLAAPVLGAAMATHLFHGRRRV